MIESNHASDMALAMAEHQQTEFDIPARIVHLVECLDCGHRHFAASAWDARWDRMECPVCRRWPGRSRRLYQ